MQVSSVAGPALGGLIIAFSVPAAYLASALAAGLFALFLALIRLPPAEKTTSGVTWSQLVAGVHFVRGQKLILAAISLDLFAVLLGGATYLLPVYATDILKVGEKGLGLLQAAPAVGALVTALLMAHRPPMQAGRPVAGGSRLWRATIPFGLSESFYLSLALFLIGFATTSAWWCATP